MVPCMCVCAACRVRRGVKKLLALSICLHCQGRTHTHTPTLPRHKEKTSRHAARSLAEDLRVCVCREGRRSRERESACVCAQRGPPFPRRDAAKVEKPISDIPLSVVSHLPDDVQGGHTPDVNKRHDDNGDLGTTRERVL